MRQIIDYIQKNFKGVSLDFRMAELNGPVPVFFVEFPDENTLAAHWEPVNSYIVSNYEPKSDDTKVYERWNTYVFFVMKTEISSALKAKIQADKFGARKLVVSGDKTDPKSLIAQYVTGTTIVEDVIGEVANESDLIGISDAHPSFLKSFFGKPASVFEGLIDESSYVENRRTKQDQDKLAATMKKILTHYSK